MKPKIWECKIGEVDDSKVPMGADSPMREAIRQAYIKLTGEEPEFIFSGWGASLSQTEREIIDERKSRAQPL